MSQWMLGKQQMPRLSITQMKVGFILSSYDKHFARVTRNQVKSCRDRPAYNPLFNVDFTLPEQSFTLQNLDTNKSPGPESIPGHFLSHLGILGRERLLYICNLSWKTGKLPRQ
ncbi:putative RNA-directed DNA polymerase from transposon BS [Trichonephila clavipes]|nr:putative RNA-directed DNA polymerase from transposon BS [Trichonephila clavipes]